MKTPRAFFLTLLAVSLLGSQLGKAWAGASCCPGERASATVMAEHGAGHPPDSRAAPCADQMDQECPPIMTGGCCLGGVLVTEFAIPHLLGEPPHWLAAVSPASRGSIPQRRLRPPIA